MVQNFEILGLSMAKVEKVNITDVYLQSEFPAEGLWSIRSIIQSKLLEFLNLWKQKIEIFIYQEYIRGKCYKKKFLVIYCLSMVMLSFCVIKQYYFSKYHRKAVVKSFISFARGGKPKYWSNVLSYFNPIKCGHCCTLPQYFYNLLQ